MSKFTKIRRWAKVKGYKIEDVDGYGGQPTIKVVINNELTFKSSFKPSTIYQSVRGTKGNAKGLYLATNNGYDIYMYSQQLIIETMEERIRKS